MTPIYGVLHEWAARPYVWGQFDCCLALADWVQRVRGFDAGEGIRGTYGNPDLCHIGRKYRENPLPILQEAFSELPNVSEPEVGDIALVSMQGTPWQFGAVALENGNWAMKSETKPMLITRLARPVAIWGVGYNGVLKNDG